MHDRERSNLVKVAFLLSFRVEEEPSRGDLSIHHIGRWVRQEKRIDFTRMKPITQAIPFPNELDAHIGPMLKWNLFLRSQLPIDRPPRNLIVKLKIALGE